jgi:hypothetical protein
MNLRDVMTSDDLEMYLMNLGFETAHVAESRDQLGHATLAKPADDLESSFDSETELGTVIETELGTVIETVIETVTVTPCHS